MFCPPFNSTSDDHQPTGAIVVDKTPVAEPATALELFIWDCKLNTDDRLKSATMRKYEAQAAAVCGFVRW